MIEIISSLYEDDVSEKCQKILGHIVVMIHLAADISVPGNSTTIGNNIVGMSTSLEIAKQTFTEHFIYLSSIPVIGAIRYTPIDENHTVMPKTPYHWSKYLCERMLEQYQSYFKTTILRIPSPIGVGMRQNTFLSMVLSKMLAGSDVEVFGKGTRIQNYIDVRDIARCFMRVIETQAEGLYLISGNESISNIQLAQMCKDILHSESSILTDLCDDPEESFKWIISSSKAKECLDFQPKYSLTESIQWILAAEGRV